MSRLRLGIVGLGLALAPHARALADLSDLYEIVGAYAPSSARRAAAAGAFGLPVTDDLDGLIDACDVGLILTPPATHTDLALRFFAAGRHVIVEKPLDTDLARAARLIEASERSGRHLGVVLQHRFREASLALEDLVTSGALGSVAVASCRVPWWRPQTYYDEPGRGTRARDGGGVLITQAIHTLDLFRALTGGVQRLAAIARTTPLHRMECEDYVAATLELANGAVGWLEASTAAYPGHPEEIRLVGSHGVATLTGGGLEVAWLDGRRTAAGAAGGTGGGADPMAFAHDAHRALLADFAGAVAAGRPPKVTGRDALATQVLIETLLEAAASGRWQDVPAAVHRGQFT